MKKNFNIENNNNRESEYKRLNSNDPKNNFNNKNN